MPKTSDNFVRVTSLGLAFPLSKDLIVRRPTPDKSAKYSWVTPNCSLLIRSSCERFMNISIKEGQYMALWGDNQGERYEYLLKSALCGTNWDNKRIINLG